LDQVVNGIGMNIMIHGQNKKGVFHDLYAFPTRIPTAQPIDLSVVSGLVSGNLLATNFLKRRDISSVDIVPEE
jgi:hypothetical protein